VTAISINLSANLLGLGGAATPYGIKAAQLLDASPHAEYASCMLFALNATSIQLLPTSVVGIRAALGSGSPADIVLPTIICTTLSTVIAVTLTFLFLGRKHQPSTRAFLVKNRNLKGAGT
jgi:spore maturation protein A